MLIKIFISANDGPREEEEDGEELRRNFPFRRKLSVAARNARSCRAWHFSLGTSDKTISNRKRKANLILTSTFIPSTGVGWLRQGKRKSILISARWEENLYASVPRTHLYTSSAAGLTSERTDKTLRCLCTISPSTASPPPRCDRDNWNSYCRSHHRHLSCH